MSLYAVWSIAALLMMTAAAVSHEWVGIVAWGLSLLLIFELDLQESE